MLGLALTLGLCGCPGPAEQKTAQQGAAARTQAVEARQLGRRLEALSALAPGASDAEASALQDLRVWLGQRRQWRAEPYPVVFTTAEGERLDGAGLRALIAAKEPVALVLSVPDFPQAPATRRTYADPSRLEPFLDLLATAE